MEGGGFYYLIHSRLYNLFSGEMNPQTKTPKWIALPDVFGINGIFEFIGTVANDSPLVSLQFCIQKSQ